MYEININQRRTLTYGPPNQQWVTVSWEKRNLQMGNKNKKCLFIIIFFETSRININRLQPLAFLSAFDHGIFTLIRCGNFPESTKMKEKNWLRAWLDGKFQPTEIRNFNFSLCWKVFITDPFLAYLLIWCQANISDF